MKPATVKETGNASYTIAFKAVLKVKLAIRCDLLRLHFVHQPFLTLVFVSAKRLGALFLPTEQKVWSLLPLDHCIKALKFSFLRGLHIYLLLRKIF